MQSDWRWCKKCQGLAFSLSHPSVCPAGGSHDYSQSGNYALAHNDPSAQGQSDWRWCRKCQGLAFSLNQPSICPAGGQHDHTGSWNYTLLLSTDLDIGESAAKPPMGESLGVAAASILGRLRGPLASKLEVAVDRPEDDYFVVK